MSQSSNKEIECLDRLNALTNSKADILTFLEEERLATKDDIAIVLRSSQQGKELRLLLNNIKAAEKFQLLEYHWQILPKEVIIITMVTDTSKREFTYTAF